MKHMRAKKGGKEIIIGLRKEIRKLRKEENKKNK